MSLISTMVLLEWLALLVLIVREKYYTVPELLHEVLQEQDNNPSEAFNQFRRVEKTFSMFSIVLTIIVCLVGIYGAFIRHDYVNDYLSDDSDYDTHFKAHKIILQLEETYLVCLIIETSLQLTCCLVVCPILIYNLFSYHPE